MVASPPPMGPERSRNAKAQARHRAKRKAYISHLEHSVSRLTTLVGVDAPSDLAQHPLTRLKALEDENAELRAEVQRLRVRLGEGPPSSTTDSATSPTFDDKRTSFPSFAPEPISTFAGTVPSGRALFSESRTSSNNSLSSSSPAVNGTGAYYSMASAGADASPTTSSSTGSPFSPSSPLALPGLKLPPAPAEQRSYQSFSTQAGVERSSMFPQLAHDQRGMLPPLPRMLPAIGSYFQTTSASPTYGLKNEQPLSPVYQMTQQPDVQQAYASPMTYNFDSYGNHVDPWSSTRR